MSEPVTANSIAFDPFTGIYKLGTNGQTLAINNGITVNAGAGTVDFDSLVDNGGNDLVIGGTVAPVTSRGAANIYFSRGISGSGDYVQNYDGVTWWRNVLPTYTGDTIINGGVLRIQTSPASNQYLNSIPSSGNITLNGGVLEGYWQDSFTRSLGSGAGQIQLTGGASGFSMHGSNSLTVNLGGSGSTIQWGSASFDPTALVLQTQYADNTSRVLFENAIDLNGAVRTIHVSAGEDGRAFAEMTGILSDSTATTAGIIKTGDGLLRLAPPNDGTNSGLNDYDFTGSIIGQGGRIVFGSAFNNTWDNESLPSTVNLELNNTLALGYFSFSRELGAGAGQVQITGGRSGFSILQGDRVDLTLGAGEVVWGSAAFNPSVFVLNDDANGNGSFDSVSVIRWNNNIDLNGADRTVDTPSTVSASSNGPNPQAFSQLINTGGLVAGNIRNTQGASAGIIKTGAGILGFSGTNTFDGDITVTQGGVFFDQLVSMPDDITVALPDGSFIGVSVGGSGWTGATSGAGSIGGLLAGVGSQSGTAVTYGGDTDLGFNVVGNVTFAGDIDDIGSDTSVTIARNTQGGSTPFLTLSGDNTYTGGTIINGTGNYTPGLGINSATAIGTGALTINGGQIDNTSGSAVTLATNNAQSWNSNFTFVGSNDLDMGSGNVTINGNRTVTVNAGKLSVGGIVQTGNNRQLNKQGDGTLEINGASAYTGTTTVSAGSLIINGSTSSTSVVNVNAGATLGGSGTVGGNTTVNGFLRPGNSPGVMAFTNDLGLGAGSETVMEINGLVRGTDHDGVNVGDALTYGGALTLDFGTLLGDGSYLFDLFDFASESGDFSSVELTGAYTGSMTNDGFGTWTTTTNSGNESWTFTQGTGVLGLTVIPEPSAAALLGSFGALLLLRRRRV